MPTRVEFALELKNASPPVWPPSDSLQVAVASINGWLGAQPSRSNTRPAGALCPSPCGLAPASLVHVLIVGRSCPWAPAWLVWALRPAEGSVECLVVELIRRPALAACDPFEGAER